MDIGSGKDLQEYDEVPYHLINILDAGEEFSVFAFQRCFVDAFVNISSRKHLPILCGGTGLYLDAVLQGYRMTEVPENAALRPELERCSSDELNEILKKLKPRQHNTSDMLDRARTIRAIQIDGFYGEAVCNHIITQKLSRQSHALETALEPALMPAQAYAAEQSAAGRVGCMLYTKVERDCRRTLYLPTPYRDDLNFIMDGLNLDRELVVSDDTIPGSSGEIDVKRFDFAGVARCMVTTPGEDVATKVAALDQELRNDNCALIQFFVDLGKPWSGGVVEQLREQGFSLGGLLPIWFGDDGLLMQKHLVDPDFDGMKIHSDRGRSLLELVRRDWEQIGAVTKRNLKGSP